MNVALLAKPSSSEEQTQQANAREFAVWEELSLEEKKKLEELHDARFSKSSKKALKNDQAALERFVRVHFPTITDVRTCPMTVCVMFFKDMHARGLKQNTLKRYLSNIKNICPSMTDQNIDPRIREQNNNIIAGIIKSLDTGRYKGKSPIPPDERNKKFDVLKGDDAESQMARTFLLFAYSTACRLNEIRNLRVSDLQWKEHLCTFRLRETKSGEEQSVSVTYKKESPYCALTELKKWLDMIPNKTPDAYVFRKIDFHGQITDKISSVKDLTQICKEGSEHPENFSTHFSKILCH
jgi:integrase